MSRDKILSKIGNLLKPPATPDLTIVRDEFTDSLETFKEMLKVAGGEVVEIDNADISIIRSHFNKHQKIVDTTKMFLDTPCADSSKEYDITIIKAKFGVAENGAIWVEWSDRYPRSLITLSDALAIVLKRSEICDTMREAYERIDFSDITYGLFLSGPSKTADIEQSLVFGAHGAVELKVFLTDSPI